MGKAKVIPLHRENQSLTYRQRRTIGFLVAARSQEEGRRRAGVGKTTLARWLQDPPFRAELTRQRNQVIEEALATLRSAMVKAAQVLVDLLDDENPRLRRFVAVDIINLVLRGLEKADLSEEVRRHEFSGDLTVADLIRKATEREEDEA